MNGRIIALHESMQRIAFVVENIPPLRARAAESEAFTLDERSRLQAAPIHQLYNKTCQPIAWTYDNPKHRVRAINI
jgi:hypothetical protein